jgi:thiosulfate/3-mercaptopyruvate sulfurtransferase
VIEPFVSVEWVQEHPDEVVLADVRFYPDGRSPQAAYDAAHIPGAVYVDLATVLAGAPSPEAGRHPLPSPERFAAGLAAAGIGDRDTVVAYDDAGGVMAARLVWLLRATGRPAAVLDGGMAAWPEPPTSRETVLKPATFTAVPWPVEKLATIDEVGELGPGEVLIDARDRPRFTGEVEPLDARGGHIPGARNVPVREHVGRDGLIAPAPELRATFAAAGIGPQTPVISYCGSGVTACHNLLAMEHAGVGQGRLYPGSWSQWSADPGRPGATGDA